ncbi:HAD-IC family P-type ATPase, partial [Candidatus Azambacteria bacterium]|nr:HAD-IC family P-type ATPase [Candidatus Azambacteria bacterium]
SPEQKYMIIEKLSQNFNTGFLGEGINDAPALKIAGVSLAVQSASGIAREAADILLLQKNLEVIINGILEGRAVFTNTIKYLKATLASNFGNFYAIALSTLFIDFLPMLPIQILMVNLLSDFPMISIATDNVAKKEVKEPQKYNVKDVILISIILGVVSTAFDFMFFGLFHKMSPETLQTNWFIGSILTELIFLFSIRTKLPFYKAQAPSMPIIFLTTIAAIITIILPFLNFGKNIFHFSAPSSIHLMWIFGLVFAFFISSEIFKVSYYKYFQKVDSR